LGRMWQTDRKLFVVISVYLVGLLWYAANRREEFPFLLYGMYSMKEYPQTEYSSYIIKVAGKDVPYTRLWDTQKEMIVSPLWHAMDLYGNNELDSKKLTELQQWLFRYIADMRFVEDNTLQVYKTTCFYDEAGNLKVKTTTKVMEYDADR